MCGTIYILDQLVF